MINLSFRFIFFLIGSFLTLNNLYFLENPLKANLLVKKNNKKEAIRIHTNKNIVINSSEIASLSELENSSLNPSANNLLIEKNNEPINLKPELNNPLNSVDIESNVQYEINNIFYAEGDVIINFLNAKFTGEKASYDKEKKQFILKNNVTFMKGGQYFEASEFSYNLKTQEGYLNNVYGVLDLENINSDLGLDSDNYYFDDNYQRKIVEDIKYIDSGTLGLTNDFEAERVLNIRDVKFKISKINIWT